MGKGLAGLAGLGVVGALFFSYYLDRTRLTGESQSPARVFYGDLERLFQESCVACHREGGTAPFSLESYADISVRLDDIRTSVLSDRMPPWPPVSRLGYWANDRRLTAHEKREILAWIEAGAAEGDPLAGLPPLPSDNGWMIGTPDTVLDLPVAIQVPSSGDIAYQYGYIPTDFPDDMWIQAIELRPTSPDVVHHMLAFLEEPPPEYRPDFGALPQERLDRPTAGRARFQNGRMGFFAAYGPGHDGVRYPPGMARLLPRGGTIKLQIHAKTMGSPRLERPELGLVFAREPPHYPVQTGAIMPVGFVIPPGNADYVVSATQSLQTTVTLLGFAPHMHLRGKSFRFEVVYPDGRELLLMDVPRYDFLWQDEYFLADPIELPAGSVLRAIGWYDNSGDNPRNPDPTRPVFFGMKTSDEMLGGYFHYSPVVSAPCEGNRRISCGDPR